MEQYGRNDWQIHVLSVSCMDIAPLPREANRLEARPLGINKRDPMYSSFCKRYRIVGFTLLVNLDDGWVTLWRERYSSRGAVDF